MQMNPRTCAMSWTKATLMLSKLTVPFCRACLVFFKVDRDAFCIPLGKLVKMLAAYSFVTAIGSWFVETA